MESKTYVFGNEGSTSNNGMLGLLAPLLQKQGVDPNVLLAMKGNNGLGSKAMSCLKKMKQERMGERMPDYRDDWRREREEREERENRRRFNNANDDWNYPNRYGERGGGGYNGGGR